MFLYELPRLFHSRHALEWKVLSPQFLLQDGVETLNMYERFFRAGDWGRGSQESIYLEHPYQMYP